jgi:hypothetical protein
MVVPRTIKKIAGTTTDRQMLMAYRNSVPDVIEQMKDSLFANHMHPSDQTLSQ